MNRKTRILFVEDSCTEIKNYIEFARSLNFETYGVPNKQDCFNLVEIMQFDYIFLDLFLSTNSETPEGLEILEKLKLLNDNSVVIVMSVDPQKKLFQDALHSGADHFIRKPIHDAQDIKNALTIADEHRSFKNNISNFCKLNNNSNPIPNLFEGLILPESIINIIKAASDNSHKNVVILGEKGVGKKSAARLIHQLRTYKEGRIPYVEVDCTRINDANPFVSFFGDNKKNIGHLTQANKGILCLNNVQSLDLALQNKIFQAIKDGFYKRFDDVKEICSEFQLVVTSDTDLDYEVKANHLSLEFRQYLSGTEFTLAPLRDRISDIPGLITLYFAKNNVRITLEELQKLAIKCSDFYWQTNISLLYSALTVLHLSAEANNEAVHTENLPILKTMLKPNSEDIYQTNIGLNDIGYEMLNTVKTAINNDVPLYKTLEKIEEHLIRAAMCRHTSIEFAQNSLELSRTVFFQKRRKYNLI